MDYIPIETTIGDMIIFRSQENSFVPGIIQQEYHDGSCRLWIFDQVAIRYVTASMGAEVGQFLPKAQFLPQATQQASALPSAASPESNPEEKPALRKP